jgi:hypothetical protein
MQHALFVDDFNSKRPWSLRAERNGRNGRRKGKDMKHGDAGVVRSCHSDGTVERVARERRKINRAEDLTEANHDGLPHLQP